MDKRFRFGSRWDDYGILNFEQSDCFKNRKFSILQIIWNPNKNQLLASVLEANEIKEFKGEKPINPVHVDYDIGNIYQNEGITYSDWIRVRKYSEKKPKLLTY